LSIGSFIGYIILLEMAHELSRFCRMARRSEVVAPRWCKIFMQRARLQTCTTVTKNIQIHSSTRGYIRGVYTNSGCPAL